MGLFKETHSGITHFPHDRETHGQVRIRIAFIDPDIEPQEPIWPCWGE